MHPFDFDAHIQTHIQLNQAHGLVGLHARPLSPVSSAALTRLALLGSQLPARRSLPVRLLAKVSGGRAVTGRPAVLRAMAR